MIKFSTGKPFNPILQERTDAVKDVMKNYKKKEIKNEPISKDL